MMKTMIAVVSLAGVAALAHAEQPPPLKINHQGRLYDSTMHAVTGSHTMTFSVYSAASGGTPLWTESQSLSFDDGYYATTLGATTPFDRTLFAGATMYLAITVDNDQEMSPREPIDSVPYSINANNVTGDITPHSVSVNGSPVIDANGHWVGANSGLVGPQGPQGPQGAQGPAGPQGPQGPAGFRSCVLRYASVGVACNSGEMLTGGGCISGGTIKSSYPTPYTSNGAAPTSWQCDGTAPLTAYAICCD